MAAQASAAMGQASLERADFCFRSMYGLMYVPQVALSCKARVLNTPKKLRDGAET